VDQNKTPWVSCKEKSTGIRQFQPAVDEESREASADTENTEPGVQLLGSHLGLAISVYLRFDDVCVRFSSNFSAKNKEIARKAPP